MRAEIGKSSELHCQALAQRFYMAFALVVVLVFGATTATARQDLIVPPSGFWVAPIKQGEGLYGATSEAANWHVTQWRSASSLSGFDHRGMATSANQRIAMRGDGYELEADGKSIPCNLEFDTFFGSNNNQGMFKGYPSAVSSDMSLAEMTSLIHTIALHPVQEIDGGGKCSQRKAIYVTSIALRNDRTQSTFFYQLRLRKYRTSLKPFWWDKGIDGKRYGFGDNLESFGLSDVPMGSRRLVKVDLLPRIKQLLSDERVSIDRDLSHWRIGTTYHGVAIWGDVKVKSKWDGYSLYAEP
jgi:hypothetical protein